VAVTDTHDIKTALLDALRSLERALTVRGITYDCMLGT
jgi:hypothetical protein